MLGVLHLFSQGGQRRFEHADLEIAMAVAQTLAVVFTNLTRQKRLQQKLKESTRTIDSLRGQLAGTVEMIGQSPALQLVQTQVAKVAPTNATVLIRGESGVGKELIARAIHVASPRAEKPFVAINCAALSMTLLESELFGHEKGAFTGASDLKIGKFELADGGTLMLDEIGEMNSEIQAKFLRALEGKPFERVGGSQSVAANVRVVAATNRDLEEAVREGNFRSDLYFRLRVIEIVVPPLRQRVEDILPLAAHFLTTISAQLGHGPSGFSASAEQALQTHSWPGNIRELRNAIERAVVLSTGELAEPDDLALSNVNVPGQSLPATPPILNVPYRERSIAEVEQDHVVATLEATEGNKSRAAAILGIERSTLDRKLKKYE
jgi:Nif-specific regulatory protein